MNDPLPAVNPANTPAPAKSSFPNKNLRALRAFAVYLLLAETQVDVDVGGPRADELRACGLLDELAGALGRFDWHSQVSLRFLPGEGPAGWSRKERAITVREGYLARFVAQGRALGR